MIKGFVFGKFLPFHVGHEAMIRFAAQQCDQLTVLVCCSDKETISYQVRVAWIKKAFGAYPNIMIVGYNYLEDELPNSSVASMHISKVWAAEFSRLLPGHTILVTSEPYGDMVAGFMGIKHMPFDPERKLFPVSASAIKRNIAANWQYLPAAVKPYYAIKVVIAGTESTGKSTLAAQLAKHYNCSIVTEAGRDVIADSTDFKWHDLYTVAQQHANSIAQAVTGNSPLIIMDTDIHITMSYSRFMFGKPLNVQPDIYELNRGVLYLYLNNDVPYMQDGTRLEESERNALDSSHRLVFAENNINLVEIKGNWNERFARATKAIDQLLRGG